MHNKKMPIKTAVVCMVYNSYEYISEFLTYYKILCDHLYIIDHNSQADLRQLDLDGVTFLRSNQEAQLQSECTNIVIEHFNIKKKYDWVFVLDIDEFLPFQDKASFHDFLNKHENEKILQFQWCNGVPFYDEANEIPPSLIDCPSIRFFNKKGVNFKSFTNIKRTSGNFYVPTGAHHINYIIPEWRKKIPFLGKYKIYKSTIVTEPLFHIVAFNKTSFVKKIKNYVEQMKYREHIKGQGGWMVRDYPAEFSGDEWLWYIANFRVSDPNLLYEGKREEFIENRIFSHLNREDVITLRQQISDLPKTYKKSAQSEEKFYLRNKKDDRDVMQNIRWLQITQHNEIICVIPDNNRKAL